MIYAWDGDNFWLDNYFMYEYTELPMLHKYV